MPGRNRPYAALRSRGLRPLLCRQVERHPDVSALIEQRELRGHHADDSARNGVERHQLPIAAAELPNLALRNGSTDDHDGARWRLLLAAKRATDGRWSAKHLEKTGRNRCTSQCLGLAVAAQAERNWRGAFDLRERACLISPSREQGRPRDNFLNGV